MKKYYAAFAVLTLVVIATIIYGFSVSGTPREKRAAQFDSTRISHLNNLSYDIEYYYGENGRLPENLSDVENSSFFSKDPETGEPYKYQKVSETAYKLCATFGTDSADAKNVDPFYDNYSGKEPKTHKKGYDCLTYEIPSAWQQSGFSVPSSETQ